MSQSGNRGAFEPTNDLLRSLAADLVEARRLYDAYRPEIEAAMMSAQQIKNALPDTGLIQIVAEAVVFARSVADHRNLERELLPRLATHGWLISPLVNADTPAHLNRIFLKDGISAVEAELMSMTDGEACGLILDDLLERPSYVMWSSTFRKALDAQERGDHELAIPIWLASLDGICKQELGRDVYAFSKQDRQSEREHLRERILPKPTEIYEPIAEAWLDVLAGFSAKPKANAPALLNRDAVLHGQYPNIGTRKDSVQCLLALHTLKWLLAVREEALR